MGAGWSHCEGDEAVVSLNVPLEDLGARPQHALEARPVQLDALERAPSDHGGRPGTVQQQGDLPCGGRRRKKVRWKSCTSILPSSKFEYLQSLAAFP